MASQRNEADRVAAERAAAQTREIRRAADEKRRQERARIDELYREARDLIPIALDAAARSGHKTLELVQVPRLFKRYGTKGVGGYPVADFSTERNPITLESYVNRLKKGRHYSRGAYNLGGFAAIVRGIRELSES